MFCLLLLCMCVTPSSELFIRCGSHGTTAAALQGIYFVTATNGASVCVCRADHNLSENTIWTIPPQPSLNFKAPPQYTDSPAAAVQHQRTLHRPCMDSYIHTRYIGTPVFPLFNLRRPRDFESSHIPKGNLVIWYDMIHIFTTKTQHITNTGMFFMSTTLQINPKPLPLQAQS